MVDLTMAVVALTMVEVDLTMVAVIFQKEAVVAQEAAPTEASNTTRLAQIKTQQAPNRGNLMVASTTRVPLMPHRS